MVDYVTKAEESFGAAELRWLRDVKQLAGAGAFTRGVPSDKDREAENVMKVRQALDGWFQTKRYPTLLKVAPEARAGLANTMSVIGSWFVGHVPSGEQAKMFLTNRSAWNVAASAMRACPALTEDELRTEFGASAAEAAPDGSLMDYALAHVNSEHTLDSGVAPAKHVGAIIDALKPSWAAGRWGALPAASRVVDQTMMDEGADALDEAEAEQIAQMKEMYEMGAFPADVVHEVLGFYPDWIVPEDRADGGGDGVDAATMAGGPAEIMRDSSSHEHVRLPTGERLGDVAEVAREGHAVGPEPKDFGNAGTGTARSQPAPQEQPVMPAHPAAGVMSIGATDIVSASFERVGPNAE